MKKFKCDDFDIENKLRSKQSMAIDDDSICVVVAANPRISNVFKH